jgi:hypothetical protein
MAKAKLATVKQSITPRSYGNVVTAATVIVHLNDIRAKLLSFFYTIVWLFIETTFVREMYGNKRRNGKSYPK